MLGDRLGPYRLDRELGSGGMGKVYAATVIDGVKGLAPEATVALKLVHPHFLEREGAFRRFMREASLGARIEHPNVVRTLLSDQLIVNGSPHAFLVMEYVEGQSLRGLQRELEQVPEELCRHIGREIARGLTAIHDAGVVHRDVKPENVLITHDHAVKLLDLGVAYLADEQMRISMSGAFVGSVKYAAPEQFGDGQVDSRCDLHALGLILYELACGQHPYLASGIASMMQLVCNEEPRRVGALNPQVSPFLEEVIHTLLAKRPDDRFGAAASLLSVLEEGEDSPWWKSRAREIRAVTNRPLRRIRIPRETSIYGRDAELGRLRHLYEQAKAADGQVVLVEGEAGIGKSRLVDELVGQLQSSGEDLNFLFGSYPPGGAATASGAFSTAYREQLGEEGSKAYLHATPILVPAFDALLKGESPAAGVERLTKDSLVTCFVNATLELAAERPTVVLIDDLHFAPEEGRALFASLSLIAPGHRILLVGTMRPGVPEEWTAGLTRYEQTSHMELDRLGARNLVELLKESFASESLATDLAGKIALKSDGIPFFVFEIVRGLREGQFITLQDDGSWALSRVIDEITIPSTVLDLVKARVADLDEADRELLDVAACCGFEFDPGIVGDVLGMPRVPALRAFAQIERRHRLVRAAGRTMIFDHHQVQEALAASLLDQLREEYHAALGEVIESRLGAAAEKPEQLKGGLAVELCEHFMEGGRGERARHYLEAAQEHLLTGRMYAQLASLTERALAGPGLLTGDRRAQALTMLGRAHMISNRPRQAETALRAAVPLADEAGDTNGLIDTLGYLSEAMRVTARFEEAEEFVSRACELAIESGDQDREILLEQQFGLLDVDRCRYENAQRHFERGLELARAIGNRRHELDTLGQVGNALYFLRRTAEADELYRQCLELGREIEDRGLQQHLHALMAYRLSDQGRFAEAREEYEHVLVIARQMGHRGFEADKLRLLGEVCAMEGGLTEAEGHIRASLAICRVIDRPKLLVEGLCELGAVLRGLGDLEGARVAQEESLHRSRECGSRVDEGVALHRLGSIASDCGDLEEAASFLEKAVEVRRQSGVMLEASLVELAGVRRLSNDEATAIPLLQEALALAIANHRPTLVALAHAHLAATPAGDLEAADSALAILKERPSRQRGRTREVRLLLWEATGDPEHLEEARRLLDAALAKVPGEHHEAMRKNLRVHREILAASTWVDPGSDGGLDDTRTSAES